MDNVSAAVANTDRSETGATAACVVTEHPSPVFIILVLDGPARIFLSAPDTSKPYTLPSVRRPDACSIDCSLSIYDTVSNAAISDSRPPLDEFSRSTPS
jgi:hypothetical protein